MDRKEKLIAGAAGCTVLTITIIIGIYHLFNGGVVHILNPLPMADETLFYCEKKSDIMVGYQNINNKCEKAVTSAVKNDTICLTSLNVCKLMSGKCGDTLWPIPTGNCTIDPDLSAINLQNIEFETNVSDKEKPLHLLIKELKCYFLDNVKHIGKKVSDKKGLKMTVSLEIKNFGTEFGKDVDESYILNIKTENRKILVSIIGTTYFGVRHGIETLMQLMVYDEKSNKLVIPKIAFVMDQPVMKYRGIMLDTARNYYGINSIKRTLDAMAMNKLNVFHWHIIDSQSFPFVSKIYPQMAAYGAFSANQVYTAGDIKTVVEYAKSRGIQVIPEFDSPARITEGWQNFRENVTGNAYYETCDIACSDLPCGQLNPTLDGIYDVLGGIYEEFVQLFNSTFFHMGGSEVNLDCWNTTKYRETLKTKGLNLTSLWKDFQQKALSTLEKVNNGNQKVILWSSSLTQNSDVNQYLDNKKYVIEFSRNSNDTEISSLINKGYDVITANYDSLLESCRLDSQKARCNPQKPCQTIYSFNPLEFSKNVTKSGNFGTILGSEYLLWSEKSGEHIVDAKLWPKAAAMSERLWSNPVTNWTEVEYRFRFHQERMISRGIRGDILESEWCIQHENRC